MIKLSDMKAIMENKNVATNQIDDYVVLNYNVASPELFNIEYGKESRGITFNKNNQSVVVRPFHKFFNLGESLSEVSIDEFKTMTEKDYIVMDKLDGSMIAIALNEDGSDLLIKTRASFQSEQAIAARKWLESKGLIDVLLKEMKPDFTYLFEYTARSNVVVILYDEEKLTLLNIRDNVTGKYVDREIIESFADTVKIDAVDVFTMTPQELLDSVDSDKDREGYVVMTKDQRFFKLKNSWYVSLHRAVSYLRERDVVKNILEDSIDDLIGFLKIENVDGKYNKLLNEIDHLFEVVQIRLKFNKIKVEYYNKEFHQKGLSFKEIYEIVSKHDPKLSSLVMKRVRSNDEFDTSVYYEHYKRFYLDEHSLRILSI